MAECSATMGRRSISLLVSCASVGAVDRAAVAGVRSATATTPATGAVGPRRRHRPGAEEGRAPVAGAHERRRHGVAQGRGRSAWASRSARWAICGRSSRASTCGSSCVAEGPRWSQRQPRGQKRVQGKNKGRFDFHSKDLIKPGSYKRDRGALSAPRTQRRVVARSEKFRHQVSGSRPGRQRSSVAGLQPAAQQARLLHDPRQASTASAAGCAVMAFRKVNGMKRTFNASPGIFRKLADGKGELPPQVPGCRQARRGRHLASR